MLIPSESVREQKIVNHTIYLAESQFFFAEFFFLSCNNFDERKKECAPSTVIFMYVSSKLQNSMYLRHCLSKLHYGLPQYVWLKFNAPDFDVAQANLNIAIVYELKTLLFYLESLMDKRSNYIFFIVSISN